MSDLTRKQRARLDEIRLRQASPRAADWYIRFLEDFADAVFICELSRQLSGAALPAYLVVGQGHQRKTP
jgi:hypothetical protein